MACIPTGREEKRVWNIFLSRFRCSLWGDYVRGERGAGSFILPAVALLVYMPAARVASVRGFVSFCASAV